MNLRVEGDRERERERERETEMDTNGAVSALEIHYRFTWQLGKIRTTGRIMEF